MPKKIHLTWKDKHIPERYQKNFSSIINTHPDWEIKIWTDEEMERFVKEQGPEYYDFYWSLDYQIQRCDFFRIFIVYVLGGIYLDMDVTIHKSFNNLLHKTQIFFPVEKIMSDQQLKDFGDRDAVRIGNYAFGSIAKHPFLLFFIHTMIQITSQIKNKENFEQFILNTTGPGLLTLCYHDYIKENPESEVTIIYPSIFTRSACGCGTYKLVASCRIGDFGIHHHYSTWR